MVTHEAAAGPPRSGDEAAAGLNGSSDSAMPDDRPVALVATTSSPWGPIHVAATDRGLVAVAWLQPIEQVIADLERRLHGEVAAARAADPAGAANAPAAPAAPSAPADDPRRTLLDRTIAELQRWLAGEPATFDLPLDLADRPAWDRAVLEAVKATPWGSVTSYGAVARAIGRPGAARAVGGAVGRNPIGIVVPCHRVIAGDGSIGGYGGDAWGNRESRLELKRSLLRLEGVFVGPPTR
jgi:methylated-DNA-[protein]-cysteine S-methyltransferase